MTPGFEWFLNDFSKYCDYLLLASKYGGINMAIEAEPPIIEYKDGNDTTEKLGDGGPLVVIHSLIAQNLK